jgi:general secretion pathway protein G
MRTLKRIARTHQADAGYTLMELLIVLAILGLLTAMATPFVLRYFDHAKVSTARTEVANLSAGLDLFKLDTGRYPTSNEGLKALLTAPAGVENWNGPYIKKAASLGDPWGRPYKYVSPGHHGDYDLFSSGPKGDETDGATKPEAASW